MSTWERAVKWARRRPAWAALIGVSAVAATALLGIILSANARLERERNRAMDRAEKAYQAVDDMYTKVAIDWIYNEPDRDPLQSEFLNRARNHYERFTEEDGNTPDLRRRAARSWFRVADIQRLLKKDADAEAAFTRAVELQETLCAEFSDEPLYRQELAETLNWFGELYREGGRRLAGQDATERWQLGRRIPGWRFFGRGNGARHGSLGCVY